MTRAYEAHTLALTQCDRTRSQWWRGFVAGLFLSLLAVFVAVAGLLFVLVRL